MNAHDEWEWEVTDTFGGEANYCWVTKGTAKTWRGAVRACRAAMGLSGKYAQVDTSSDVMTIRPPKKGPCIIGFVY